MEPAKAEETSVLTSLCSLLDQKQVPYRLVHHAVTLTSEESARARNEALHVGAKALLLKIDTGFKLVVIPAHRKLDSAGLKRALKAASLRFATPEELHEQTGLVPGSVPPFGQPILHLDLIADALVGLEENRVAFNAGSLTDSIIMARTDWVALARPQFLSVSK